MPIAIGVVSLLGLAYLTYWAVAIVVRLLAERNLFWTLVTEPTAKAIVVNGVVSYMLMNHMGRRFAGLPATGPVKDIADQYEIVEDPNHIHLTSEGIWKYLPSFRGIRWIGVPPSADAYQYRFSWGSLEERSDENGVLKSDINWNEKDIDYIILLEDVYATKLEGFECKDNIPLDTVILISGYIKNPYKALFRIEHWLEAVRNMIGAKMRDFFGRKTYRQLMQFAESKDVATRADVMPKELRAFFNENIEWIEKNWGFKISFIRIHSVNPGSDLASDFIRATTQVYVATQKADAAEEEGRGLAARDTAHFGAIAKIEGGVTMFKYQRIGESNLTTYVEGGGAIPAIALGGQPTPSTPLKPKPKTGKTASTRGVATP